MSKVTTCLWFGRDAASATRFYVSIVADSAVASRAFTAMQGLVKLDGAALERAAAG